MEEQDLKIWIERVVLKDETFTDKDAVWKKIVHRIEQPDTLKQPRIRSHRLGIKRYWRIAVSIAAVVCLVIGLGSRENITSTNNELQHVLPDGSTVHLAENSSIRYNRIGWWFVHRVTLDGNASFTVTKQKGKFSVVAKMGTITVLGTKFSIEQQADNLRVACTEGSVAVKTDIGTEVLHKDQQLDYNGLQMQVSPIYPDYLEFNNAPLSDVMTQIERIYGLTVINNDSCSGSLFSGWVSTRNIDEALEVIMGSCGLNYDLTGNVLTINH